MTNALNASAQRLQNALAERGMDLQVVELASSTRTAAEAAAAIGCGIGQIAKSIVFRTAGDGRPLLVIASGANRVDEKKLAALVAQPVEKPDAAYVREQTGYVIGGVPPLGHAQSIRTVVDQDLLAFEKVWAAAGSPNSVFMIGVSDLLALTGAEVRDVKPD